MYAPQNVEQFTTLCKSIHGRFPRLGYVHMVESRGGPAKLQNWAVQAGETPGVESLDSFRSIFEGSSTAFLSAGGHTPAIAREVVKVHGGAVVFGGWFISNPDLPRRLRDDLPLTHYDRSTFFTHGHEGYTTYQFWSQPTTPQSEWTEAVKT